MTEQVPASSNAAAPSGLPDVTPRYRGSKYHFDSEGNIWWSVPESGGRINARSGVNRIAPLLLAKRKEGGSFRITEAGEILTLKSDPDGVTGEVLQVGKYQQPLEFEGVDVLGKGISAFDLWPSFYDGARYSFRGDKIWWHNPKDGTDQYTNESLPPALLGRLARVKPQGGRFCVTENGCVLTLIPPQPLPANIVAQFGSLSDLQRNLVRIKTETAEMIPIFIGTFKSGFTLKPVRRLTDPLTDSELERLSKFLKQYDSTDFGREPLPVFADDRPEETE